MLGENGTGKTTFIKILSGRDKEASGDLPKLDVSVKPQEINPKWEGTVKELLYDRVKDLWQHPKFVSDVCRPLKLDDLLDLNVTELSGGEQQRVALVLSLCRPAHVYLIDEPSANLDSELRVIASKVIKRYILNTKRAAFVVEHDFIMSTYLADQVIVF
jgi:ATP-binding cassette, sub-family E, member 1